MSERSKKAPLRPRGYPSYEKVVRGCRYIAQSVPNDVFITCIAQLHNLSKRKTAALLQILKISTLAGMWMLRDIEQRKPEQRFASYRKRNSTRYLTDGIVDAIDKVYRRHMRSRYTLNSNVFRGLCTTIGSMTSSYLQKVTEARQKGLIQQYDQCAAYVVKIGRHQGKALGTLGRKTIFGYAFLMPKREQCEEALRHITVLLEGDQDDIHLVQQAAAYKMNFGLRRNCPFGSMRSETLHRLKLLVERDLQRSAEFDELRKVAQTYLRFTPPRFPRVRSGGLSSERQRDLHEKHMESLEEFGKLPEIDHDDALFSSLTEDERQLFRELQHHAYAATEQTTFIPIRWDRADACLRHRDCALLYDPAKRQYLFLAYLLADSSRYKRVLTVNGDLYDVNNPHISLKRGWLPTTAMLFELEFDSHQQHILEQARHEADHWKNKPESSAGSIRSATLHAHYSQERKHWWFEVHLSVGFKPTHIERSEHVVGVHVDPLRGMFVTVLNLDGSIYDQFALDEHRIAIWLENKNPAQQARLKPSQRTAKERQHRIADALVAICRHYRAQLGVENIAYRRGISSGQNIVRDDSSRTIVELLRYKLALANLPDVIDVKNIAPRRDCSHCGTRHNVAQVYNGQFSCSVCGQIADRHVNTACEVARRVLWVLAQKSAPKRKKVLQEQAVGTE